MDGADLGDITIIDARGHRCPVPALRLRRALEAAALGERLRLMADDPMALIDVPLLVKQCGYRVDKHTKIGADLIFEIVKSPVGSAAQ
jgi:tRNA 2-thiouridine synthesizing protein A